MSNTILSRRVNKSLVQFICTMFLVIVLEPKMGHQMGYVKIKKKNGAPLLKRMYCIDYIYIAFMFNGGQLYGFTQNV